MRRAARCDGEELVVLIGLDGGDGPKDMAERLRHAIEEARSGAGIQSGDQDRPVALTASVGASGFMAGDRSYPNAFERTNQGMYAAKAAGRNYVVKAQLQAAQDLKCLDSFRP